MSRLVALLTRHGVDLLIVIAAVGTAAGTLLQDEPYRADGFMLLFETLVATAAVLVLLARTRFPFAAPAALWLLAASLSFVDGRLVVSLPLLYLAGLGAALLLGNVRDRDQARVGLAIVLVGSLIIMYNDPTRSSVGEFVFIPALFVIGWLVGYALRQRSRQAEAAEDRAAQAEREREAAARIAVAEERSRIARELHDVVAHAVSVMVLQTGAVRHRMPDEETEARDTLRNVEHVGRTALAEMRRLLGAMRSDGEAPDLAPRPGLQDLDALLDDVRSAGLTVHLQIHGEPYPLPPGLDLSAYRILQEGLTNTLKHARASEAVVDVEYGATDLRLEVRDDGRVRAAAQDGLGHGLVGVSERVKIYGGEMSARRSRAGGFVLRVRLPVDGRP